jgi:hypothetical protein
MMRLPNPWRISFRIPIFLTNWPSERRPARRILIGRAAWKSTEHSGGWPTSGVADFWRGGPTSGVADFWRGGPTSGVADFWRGGPTSGAPCFMKGPTSRKRREKWGTQHRFKILRDGQLPTENTPPLVLLSVLIPVSFQYSRSLELRKGLCNLSRSPFPAQDSDLMRQANALDLNAVVNAVRKVLSATKFAPPNMPSGIEHKERIKCSREIRFA